LTTTEYSPTDPSIIKIYTGDIEREYIVLAPVAADIMGDGEKVARYLKQKSAKLGADAIIYVKLSKVTTTDNRTGISGVAVKFK
jgi:uncharacterized protein YbjQ (UPF0145 family)